MYLYLVSSIIKNTHVICQLENQATENQVEENENEDMQEEQEQMAKIKSKARMASEKAQAKQATESKVIVSFSSCLFSFCLLGLFHGVSTQPCTQPMVLF